MTDKFINDINDKIKSIQDAMRATAIKIELYSIISNENDTAVVMAAVSLFMRDVLDTYGISDNVFIKRLKEMRG